MPELHLTLHPCPPFDFGQSLAFAEGFTPTRAETGTANGTLTRLLSLEGRAVELNVREGGEALRLHARSEGPLDGAALLDRARFWLSLDDDLGPFYRLAEADPPFAPVLARLHGYHQVKFVTPFEALAWALLTQRTPQAVARRLKRTLSDTIGPALDGKHAFPEPGAVAEASAAQLADLMPALKAGRLQAAARAFSKTPEDWLRRAPLDEVRAWLLALPGVGPFSASLTLIRGLGRMAAGVEGGGMDAAHLLDAARQVYGPGLDAADLGRLAEHYGDQRGWWAHYLRAGARD